MELSVQLHLYSWGGALGWRHVKKSSGCCWYTWICALRTPIPDKRLGTPDLKASHLGCLKEVKVQGGRDRSPEEHAGTVPGAKGIGLWTESSEVQWCQWGLVGKERKPLMWSIQFCTVLWKQYLLSEKEEDIIYCITCCYTSVEWNKMTATAWFLSPKQANGCWKTICGAYQVIGYPAYLESGNHRVC